MGIKDAAKRIVYGPKASSETYIPWLRSLGMVIGDNCMVYAPTKTIIDVQHPWMIEMGNNVQITEGVTILTHGYDWSVFKGKYGDVLGSAGHVKIGSNVFIGMNVTILKGTTIGDNVVIGANSLINKDVPSDCVVVGNPQRVICSIDEYLEKRRAAQVDEAIDLYSCWRRNSPEGRRGGEYLRGSSSASSSGSSKRASQGTSRARSTRASWGSAGRAARASAGSGRQVGSSMATRSSSPSSTRASARNRVMWR